jgi:hypothetical protein
MVATSHRFGAFALVADRASPQEKCRDCRESPALDVMRLLSDKGAILAYNDPFVPH